MINNLSIFDLSSREKSIDGKSLVGKIAVAEARNPVPVRLFAQSPKSLIRVLFFNLVVQIPLSTRFYTEKWITDEDYIPTGPADLMVLRTKFEESVRRHLLAEVAFTYPSINNYART